MQELADIDAKAMRTNLINAVHNGIKKIILLMHVAPFDGVCWHEGKISDSNWMPCFTSKVIGDVILPIAKDNQQIDFFVLCGHTHSG